MFIYGMQPAGISFGVPFGVYGRPSVPGHPGYGSFINDVLNIRPSDPQKQITYYLERAREAERRGDYSKARDFRAEADRISRALGGQGVAGYTAPSAPSSTLPSVITGTIPGTVPTFDATGETSYVGPVVALGVAGAVLAGAVYFLKKRRK